MHLVLIETSGNQNFIFATNKLRENVGASELTYQIGTRCVLEAVGKGDIVKGDIDGSKLQAFLLDAKQNLFLDGDGHKIEVIIATSGKAILLVDDHDKAKKIVTEVTKKALVEMPGLTVHGAIETVADDLTDIHGAVGKVHRSLENLRYKIPSSRQRFPRLPHVEPCATSGLPANQIYKHELLPKTEEAKPHSVLSITKQKKADEGRSRLERTIQLIKPNIKLMTNINDLEKKFKETKWLATIHADGNGLGEIFLSINTYLGLELTGKNRSFKNEADARTYIEAYRKFSISLDICTINAAAFALENFQITWKKNNPKEKTGIDTIELPFIPLILGGDDLTVLCDGEYALKFTHDFLTRFEEETAKCETILQIVNNAFGNKDPNSPSVKMLGICAGVAIVKPHYPFHQAYELAEELLKSAKTVKTRVRHMPKGTEVSLPCSAMDFHVLYDSSGVELNEIREKLKVDEGTTYLYAKPYVVTPKDTLKEKLEFKDQRFTNRWLNARAWDNLATRVCAMSAKDEDDKNKLPNSQLHHIRESLQRGKAETDSEINLFSHRYKDKGFDRLLWQRDAPKSLFFDEKYKREGIDIDGHATHFLDALDVVEFWKGFDCKECEEKDKDVVADNSIDGGKQ